VPLALIGESSIVLVLAALAGLVAGIALAVVAFRRTRTTSR